ncbi:MAG: hypothetical protein KatS3mg110_0699 [Pirellulaceae bacterium]|nr:MAG: hypothetical protein KatS3mg110_0699 [Pirellulaceae bacterium]
MHRWKPTLFLVGTVLAGWALYWVVTFSGSPQVPPPELYIEPAALDIGSVWDTDRYVHSLSITNRSSQPVTITGWYRSCECRSIEPERLVLGPGEAAPVRLTINLRATCSQERREPRYAATDAESIESEPEPAAFRVWFQPKVAGYRGPLAGWHVSGAVRTWAKIHPSEISLGELVRGVPVELPQATLVCFAPIKALDIVVEPQTLLVNVERVSSMPDRYRLQFFPHPEWPEGLLDVRVRLRGTTADGQELSGPVLSVFGRIVPTVRAHPSALFGSPTQIGTWIREQIALESRLGEPVEVVAVDVLAEEGPDAEVQVERIGDAEPVYRVAVLIAQPGSIRRQLIFRVRTHSGKEETIRVPLVYYGVKP